MLRAAIAGVAVAIAASAGIATAQGLNGFAETFQEYLRLIRIEGQIASVLGALDGIMMGFL